MSDMDADAILADVRMRRIEILEAEIEQLRQMVRDAATALNEEERENERLYDAIFRHRERIWGEGKVEHPEDVTLYEALGNE